MGEIRIVGPGKTRGYPYPVCKKTVVLLENHRKTIQFRPFLNKTVIKRGFEI